MNPPFNFGIQDKSIIASRSGAVGEIAFDNGTTTPGKPRASVTSRF
jgi:hypothetical protein